MNKFIKKYKHKKIAFKQKKGFFLIILFIKFPPYLKK